MAKLNNLIINENGIEKKAILYDKNFAPAKIIHNGNVLTNVSFRDKLVEGTNQVTYQSEYKKNLLNISIEGNTIQKLLPDEYQEVEFIQSVLKQGGEKNQPYIDTGVIPTINTGVNIVYQSLNYRGYSQFIIGARNRNGGTIFYGLNGSSSQVGGKYLWSAHLNGTSYRSTMERTDNKMQSILMPIGNGAFEWKLKNLETGAEETITTSATTINTIETIRIFGFSDTHTLGGLKVFECQIYDSGNLVRYYIPCYRKNDGQIGLFDLVQKTFNISPSGEFTKGEDIQSNISPTPTTPQEIVNTDNISVELSANGNTSTVQISTHLASQDKLLVNYVDKSVKVNRAYVKLDLVSLDWVGGISSTTNITFFYATTPYQFTGKGLFSRGEVKTINYAQLNEMQNTVIVEGTTNQIKIAFSPDFDLKLDSNSTRGDVDKLIDWLSNNPCEVLLKVKSNTLTDTYTDTWASDLLNLPTQNATNIITVNSNIPTSKLDVNFAEWGGRDE